MTNRVRLYSLAAGGISFWLPGLVVFAILRGNMSVLWASVAPLAGLVTLAVIDCRYFRWPVAWGWALGGIYLLGPISILMESWVSGGKPPWSLGPLLVAFLLVPPITLWLSFYSLQFFVLLAVSAGLPILE